MFADIKEFAVRVSDLVADSLATVMAELPDKDVSDNQERKVHAQFRNVKSALASKIKKLQRNVTTCWEDLLADHYELMYDSGRSSLADYGNRTERVTDSYLQARRSLDSILSSFIDFIESTLRDGLTGIKAASERAIKKEKETNEAEEKKEASEDDILREKMVEITNMIVPGFLGKVTVQVVEKKMDLSRISGISPEDRDSVLDDIVFDMLMVRNRIRAFVHSDVPRDKGSTDLARRSIYTFWADMAEQMYREKIQSGGASETGRLYYRNLWKDEQQLMDTLLNLMEVFP